jgi:diaminopimelate epimerase
MDFVKMHGAGNDYVYVDMFAQKIHLDPAELARLVSDRHFGIGSDGLIFIEPSGLADVRMRMFNADGSEAEMCGNGIRCVAKYAVDQGLAETSLSVETLRGVLRLEAFKDASGRVDRVRAGMGQPDFNPEQIPVEGLGSAAVLDRSIELQGRSFRISTVSMGNPHCVVFVDNVDTYAVDKDGPLLEKSIYFPRHANIEFVEIVEQNRVKIRTWERGSGETLACGTGASAVCAVLHRLHGWNGVVRAALLGGELQLEYADNQVYMCGPAVEVYRGVYPL